MGSIWGRFGIDLGSICDHFGIILGSFWDHSGITLASLWAHFRKFLRKQPKFQNRSETSSPASGGPKLSLCDHPLVKRSKIEKYRFFDFSDFYSSLLIHVAIMALVFPRGNPCPGWGQLEAYVIYVNFISSI